MKYLDISIAIVYIAIAIFRTDTSNTEFSADIKIDGLDGAIIFVKKTELEPAIIKVNINGSLKPSHGLQWEIRDKPSMHVYGLEDGYCNHIVAESKLLYNLTADNDLLPSRGVYINEKLVVDYSEESILGHSIVIKDGVKVLTCATILPANQNHDEMDIYKATFNQMLGGEMFFFQIKTTTLILGYIYGIDMDLFGITFDWKLVHLKDSSVIDNYDGDSNSRKNCSRHNKENCPIGELGILSEYLIGNKPDNGWKSMHHVRHIFPNLDITKLNLNEIGIKLEPFIKNTSMDILYPLISLDKVEQSRFKPLLFENDNGQVVPEKTIHVEFYQPTPYHTTYMEAKIDIHSYYFKNNSKFPTFTIYNTESSTGRCDYSTYSHDLLNSSPPLIILDSKNFESLPPFKNFTDSMFHLEYPIFASLFGPKSILESILLIKFIPHDDNNHGGMFKNQKLICGPIRPAMSQGLLHSSAIFRNETGLYGSVDMIQYLFNTTRSDTVIWINLKNNMGNKSKEHMVHIHEYAPDKSSQDAYWRCSITAGHFNPYMIQRDNEYGALCNEITARRCEVGDISGKYGPYNIGYGEIKIVDPTIELYGKYTPNGRSIVIHGPQGETDYDGCETIIIN